MSKEYTRIVTLLDAVPAASRIIYYDDFENLLKLTNGNPVGDNIFELDPTVAFLGAQSLHLKTRTTDSADDDHIDPYLHAYFLPEKIFTFTMRFKCPILTTIKTLQLRFSFYDGATFHQSIVTWSPNIPKWQYRNSGGTDSDIPSTDFVVKENVWHYVSFSVDFNTNFYRHLQIDHLFFNMSNLALRTQPSEEDIQFQTSFPLQCNVTGPAEMHVDELLLHAF